MWDGTMHAFYSNVGNMSARFLLTAWLIFQYGVGFGVRGCYSDSGALVGPTNYDQCLYLSE